MHSVSSPLTCAFPSMKLRSRAGQPSVHELQPVQRVSSIETMNINSTSLQDRNLRPDFHRVFLQLFVLICTYSLRFKCISLYRIRKIQKPNHTIEDSNYGIMEL